MVNDTVVLAPLQTDRFAGWLTCPSGFTVMVKLFEGPGQFVPPLLNVGVTVIVPVIGALVELVAVKEILPFPLPARLIAVLLFVQAYEVVPTALF